LLTANNPPGRALAEECHAAKAKKDPPIHLRLAPKADNMNKAQAPDEKREDWSSSRLRQVHLGACHVSAAKIALSLGKTREFAVKLADVNKTCLGCATGQGNVKLPQSSGADHKSAAAHFNDRMTIDHIIKLGPCSVWVMEDEFSRYVRVVCQPGRNADITLASLREKWEADFYLPRRFRHDVDRGFADMDAYLQASGSLKEPAPPHAPQYDGLNERAHQTLGNMYRSTMAQSGLPQTPAVMKYIMENHVPDVYNNLRHSATKQAPVKAALGLEPNLENAPGFILGNRSFFNRRRHNSMSRRGGRTGRSDERSPKSSPTSQL
jgi:hypothetical protein